MEEVAQREIGLHKKVGDELKAMGHASETVPAQERPVLRGGFRPGDIIPEDIDNAIFGEGPDKYIGVTHSGALKRMVDWIRKKKGK